MAKLLIEVDTRKATSNIKSLDKEVSKFAKNAKKDMKSVEKSAGTMGKAIKSALTVGAGIVASGALVEASRVLIDIADTYTLIESKIKISTDSQEDFNKVYEELYRISRDTGSTLETNAQAFNKLSQAADFDVDDLIRSQEILNKAMVVNGTTAAESASFMLQYAQAMGSGVVNGDELRSMNEANAYVMGKIAKELDTTIAGLRKMGAAGTLTSEKFFKALLKVGGQVEETYGEIPKTVARSWNELTEVFKRVVGDVNASSGGTEKLAESISMLAVTIDQNRTGIIQFFDLLADSTGTSLEISGLSSYLEEVSDLVGYIKEIKALTTDSIGFDSSEVSEFTDKIKESVKEVAKAATPIGFIAEKLGLANDIVEATKETYKSFADEVDSSTLSPNLEIDLKGNYDREAKKYLSSLEGANEKLKQSAEAWLAEYGKGAEKMLNKYVDDIKRANAAIIDDTRDLQSELSALSREGMTDEEAWKSVTQEIQNYKQQAQEAAKAGDWDSQLDFLKRAKDLIRELPSEGVVEIVGKDSVADAKKTFEYVKRITRGGIGDSEKFKKAYQDYQKAVRDAAKGEKEVISSRDALNEKMSLTKEIGNQIIEAQKQGVERLGDEAKSFQDTYNEYQKVLNGAKADTLEVFVETEKVKSEWSNVGETVSGVGSDYDKITGDMIRANNEVAESVDSITQAYKDLAREQGNTNLDISGISGQRALGGPVQANDTYLVGERGPELFTPNSSGFITPNDQLGSSKTSDTVNINFNIGEETVQLQGERSEVAKMQRYNSLNTRFASA